MKKTLLISALLLALTSGSVYAAKYSVNTSGTVKSNGQVIAPVAVPVQQGYPASQNTYAPNYGYANSYSSPNYSGYYNPNNYNGYNQNYNVYNAQNYVANNQVNATTVQNIELVMDYSGSMSSWIYEAKNAMTAIIRQIPQTTSVGFRVFGHDENGINPSNTKVLGVVSQIVKKNGKYQVQTKASPVGNISGACSATKQVTPLMFANANALISGMNSVGIGGSTPMVYALDRAINEDFAMLDRTKDKKIVLITDGGENCGGDPCAYAEQLIRTRRDIHVDVVLVSSYSDGKLQCLADKTGGNLYKITNLSDFLQTVTRSMNAQPQEIPEQYYEYYEE